MTAPRSTGGGRGATKLARQEAILALVAERPVRTQDSLVDGLRRRRLHATQTTISRDIQELGLIRVHDRDGGHYAAPSPPGGGSEGYAQQLAAIFRDHVISIEFVGNLGVIRTHPSSAPLVGAALDSGLHREIAGTVAGDDTLLVVVRGTTAARGLHSQLVKLTGNDG